ncbi:hypothetical protein Bca52824_040342 [Brassica carinata]|uniref:F-box/kelch-repeat protein n=1 Tax=Brassica carinata TaxID=52824 RepID=A0A8X7RUP5_BRACI|nr:hypothetical protein Bca52824_040342 [Brassica carinata]
MTVAKKFAEAAFIDGKIFVTGGTEDTMNWVEIFDLKTQTWTPLPSPNNAKLIFMDESYTLEVRNYCGTLIILWDELRSHEFPMPMRSRCVSCKRIWYAVIRLEKSLSGFEILGKIERSNALLTDRTLIRSCAVSLFDFHIIIFLAENPF